VICVPQASTRFKPPLGNGLRSRRSAEAFDAAQFGQAVKTTHAADAAIAFEYALTEVSGVAPQFPFFDTLL
jgi:hypothetical protein